MQNTKSSIVYCLRDRIDFLKPRFGQTHIAARIGFKNPSMLSMMKRGEVKVPLDRIPSIARVLEVDPTVLFRLALEQHWDDPSVIEDVFSITLSANEVAFIELWREITDDNNPSVTPELASRVAAIVAGSSTSADSTDT